MHSQVSAWYWNHPFHSTMIINQTTPIRCDNHHNLLIFCITFEIFSISDIRQDTCYNPSPLLRCASKLAKIQEYAEMAVSAIVLKLLDARRMSIISFQNCLITSPVALPSPFSSVSLPPMDGWMLKHGYDLFQ